jgi:HEAT repeat protein
MVDLLQDDDLHIDVRIAAGDALGKLGDSSVLAALRVVEMQAQSNEPQLARTVRIARQRVTALAEVR